MHMQSTRIVRPAIGAAVLVALVAAALLAGAWAWRLSGSALAAGVQTHADAVTQWNLNATNALMVTAAQPPQQSVLHMAMVHGAVYDAVNAIDGGHEGYLLHRRRRRRPIRRRRRPRRRPTACSCISARRSRRRSRRCTRLAGRHPGRPGEDARDRRRRGRGGGDDRGADGRWPLRPVPLRGRLHAGRVAAGAARVRQRPERLAQGREAVPDPRALRSSAPRAACAHEPEVRARVRGGEVARLGDEHDADGRSDATPPATGRKTRRRPGAASSGRWRRSRGCRIAENARLFAMLYLTAADALISVWDDKAYWSFWRPITAIREADTDGNRATEPDAAWLPLIPTPPYPEHPSGPPGPQRLDRRDAAGLLRHGQDRLERHEQRRSDAELHPLLAGDRRDHRRAYLVGHPLPDRGRAGRAHRQEVARWRSTTTSDRRTRTTTTDPRGSRGGASAAPLQRQDEHNGIQEGPDLRSFRAVARRLRDRRESGLKMGCVGPF